jgi:hypothetical protein
VQIIRGLEGGEALIISGPEHLQEGVRVSRKEVSSQ